MEVAEILHQFERLAGKFPRAAVEAAIEQRDAIAPELLRILEEVTREPEKYASDDRYMAHFYAMYLLAQFRDSRAYPLVVCIAQFPSDLLEELCGDFVTATLGQVLASVCGGDLKGIQSIIQNEQADEWARGAGLSALVTLVNVGDKSRDEIVGYFELLFRGDLERQPSFVWDALVGSACDLWPEELFPYIEQAWEEDLTDDMCMDMDDFQTELARGKEAAFADLATKPYHRLIGDTVKEFGSWACFQPQKARIDKRLTTRLNEPPLEPPAPLPPSFSPTFKVTAKIGRNDPCPCGSGKKYKKCCLN